LAGKKCEKAPSCPARKGAAREVLTSDGRTIFFPMSREWNIFPEGQGIYFRKENDMSGGIWVSWGYIVYGITNQG
jgi:hypothetical protein